MQDAYETPFDRYDSPVDVDEAAQRVEARLDRLEARLDQLERAVDQLEATVDRFDAMCYGLDRFGRTMRRCLLVLMALNLASTSFIAYVAVQIGSGHRW